MAGEGVQNMIARRVTDDLIVFSGETSPSRYTKFLLEQKIAESRRFVERMRSEVATSRDCIAQLNAVVAEFEAMENQEEVHDSWLAAKDARRGEQGSAFVERLCLAMVKYVMMVVSGCVFCCLELGEGEFFLWLIPCFVMSVWLAEIAESPRLGDKMKYVFEHSRGEDESLSRMMVDLCVAYRVSLGKKRRLIAELEAAGEVDGAAKCLEHMKVVVARDAVTLGDLETVWARCQVGKSLKAGFVADMEVQK
ncbi:hypothetical protein Tco_1217327 [Tanacetum coccineum]